MLLHGGGSGWVIVPVPVHPEAPGLVGRQFLLNTTLINSSEKLCFSNCNALSVKHTPSFDSEYVKSSSLASKQGTHKRSLAKLALTANSELAMSGGLTAKK